MRGLHSPLQYCLLGAILVSSAEAAEYRVGPADSKLGFAGEVSEERFDGQFHQFAGEIAFDPADLAETRFNIEIDMRSVDTQSEERDEALASNEWFDPEQFPAARFRASGARASGDGFVSAAELIIRGIAKPVEFHFKLSPDGQRLLGTATLNRIDWDLGGEDWSDQDLVSHTVLVEVEVKLIPKG